MVLQFGTDSRVFLRDWMLYVSIQLFIFVKVVIFFFIFGHGLSYYGQPVALEAPFVAMPVFANSLQVWDYLFHQLMHVLIAVWVLLYAKHVKKIVVKEMVFLFAVATVLHNVGYWLTAAHPSWLYSLRDAGIDFVSLWIFFAIFYLGFTFVPRSQKWEIPYFDKLHIGE